MNRLLRSLLLVSVSSLPLMAQVNNPPAALSYWATNGASAGTFALVQNKEDYTAYDVPSAVIANNVCVKPTTADNSANLYDIGVYGPNCWGSATGVPLALHTGATAGSAINAGATGPVLLNATGANLTPGWYCLALTSSAASPTLVLGSDSNTRLAAFTPGLSPNGTTGNTTGGVLNSTIDAPTSGVSTAAITPWISAY